MSEGDKHEVWTELYNQIIEEILEDIEILAHTYDSKAYYKIKEKWEMRRD